ncbi:MAG TPA: histidine kinase dimerization/phospho-acceptor domain-containing protein, partial [Terriglobales bacterium]|nr:histidine kinase dimerization/phospho-acceptor domain-containing protein [Terriglobales bacterium]
MGKAEELDHREQRLMVREAAVARREWEMEGVTAIQEQVSSAARRTLEDLMELMRQVNESLVLFSAASLERSDAAEAASRSKDEFLATASHELRSPLSAVEGWIGLIESGNLSPADTAHALRVIENNVRILSRMIEDLLDAARDAAGNLRIHRQPTELWKLALDAMDSAQPEARSKGIGTSARLGTSSTLRVLGDPERLR